MALSYRVNSLTGTQIQTGNVRYNEEAVQQYLRNQSGPLSTIGGGEVIGKLSLSLSLSVSPLLGPSSSVSFMLMERNPRL